MLALQAIKKRLKFLSRTAIKIFLKSMQTDTITITCTNNIIGSNNTCTTSSWFSGGEFFISLLLLILIIFTMINMLINAVFTVKIFKEYTGVNQLEGKEHYIL